MTKQEEQAAEAAKKAADEAAAKKALEDAKEKDAQTGDDDDADNKDKKDDKLFDWGFDEDDDDDDQGDGLDDDDKDADKDKKPEELELIKQELRRVKEQARLKDDHEKLSKKYSGMDNFPEVDKKSVVKFLKEDFGKLSPMEVGYLLSNFKGIVEATRKSAEAKVGKDYTPEVLAEKEQNKKNEKRKSTFDKASERLKSMYGIKSDE